MNNPKPKEYKQPSVKINICLTIKKQFKYKNV